MSSITESNTNNTDNQSGIYKKKVQYILFASNGGGDGDDWGDVEVESLVS